MLNNNECTRAGYLYRMEKKTLGVSWTKCYCQYIKENKLLYLIPYNQMVGRITNTTEQIRLSNCVKRMDDELDRRFCFDIMSTECPRETMTFQVIMS